MATMALGDLSIGTLCKIGVTISSYFWVPAGVVLGILAATGSVPAQGWPQGGVAGFFAGFLQGIAASLAMDTAIVLGVLSYAIARRGWGAVTFPLKQRGLR